MQNQINKAFAQVNADILARQTAWFEERNAAVRAYYKSEERKAVLPEFNKTSRKEYEAARKADTAKLEAMAGGKTWLAAIWCNPTEENRATYIGKNVKGLIYRRDSQILKALESKGIKEIPDFELVQVGDGLEGVFMVAGHRISIRTILAGGYNIQCLHMRTLVKIS
ncbi:MAG: hypothetical protein ACRCYS_17500 [Beijerinckiaceae bacterium]